MLQDFQQLLLIFRYSMTQETVSLIWEELNNLLAIPWRAVDQAQEVQQNWAEIYWVILQESKCFVSYHLVLDSAWCLPVLSKVLTLLEDVADDC